MKTAIASARSQMDTLLDSLLGIARIMPIWMLPLMIPITMGLLGLLLLAYTFIAIQYLEEGAAHVSKRFSKDQQR
jgi:hypothetical protein